MNSFLNTAASVVFLILVAIFFPGSSSVPVRRNPVFYLWTVCESCCALENGTVVEDIRMGYVELGWPDRTDVRWDVYRCDDVSYVFHGRMVPAISGRPKHKFYQRTSVDQEFSYMDLYTLSYEQQSDGKYLTFLDEWGSNYYPFSHHKLPFPPLSEEQIGLAQRLNVDWSPWDLRGYVWTPSETNTKLELYEMFASPHFGQKLDAHKVAEVEVPKGQSFAGGSAFDLYRWRYKDARGLLYLQFDTTITVFDVRNEFKRLWTLENQIVWDTMAYDPLTTLVFGTAVDKNKQRVLLTLDRFGNTTTYPFDEKYQNAIESLPIGVVNSHHRQFFCAVRFSNEEEGLYHVLALNIDENKDAFGQVDQSSLCSLVGPYIPGVGATYHQCPHTLAHQIPNSDSKFS